MKQQYTVRIESPFILTQKEVKEKLGIGHKVISVERSTDIPQVVITDIDSAAENIVLVGYRALARAYHPDLGGDAEVMVWLNKSKKELLDLLKEVKGMKNV